MTGATSAGKIGTSEVYRLTNLTFISMRGHPPDEEKVKSKAQKGNLTSLASPFLFQVGEIKKLLTNGTFYYSYATPPNVPINLTLAAQKTVKHSGRTDNRFFW